MKLIVGLGNIGEKYQNNRHNIGWMVLDELKQKISKSEFPNSTQFPNPNFQNNEKMKAEICKVGNVILAKPTTYMNDSGQAILALYTKYKVQNTDLYVVHDDLDILLGFYKIQFGKGPKKHNGLNSVYEALGTKDFWHVRVGIENRNDESGIVDYHKKAGKVAGEEYVLQDFEKNEISIKDQVIGKLPTDLANVIYK